MTLEAAYNLVASVASPSDSEGLKKERAILLLWYLRNALGVDDLEAYEFICDGDDDQGVDGMFLERAGEDQPKDVLHIFQSKYPEKPKNVGVTDVRALIGALAPFETAAALRTLLAGKVEPELAALIERFALIDKLDAGTLTIEATLVVAGELTNEARELIRAENLSRGREAIRGVDVFDLAPLIEAFTSPSTIAGAIKVNATGAQRFIAPLQASRVAVCSVAVSDLVKWPGISDRKLFELNVRRELSRASRVRRALNRAIKKTADHRNFLAFHNGLTVVCSKIDDTDPGFLTVTDLSVVNGAQSTIAFWENRASVTPDLRIVVKFVEVPGERQLAREVAIRSNTQNPVNARNLRARDGIQLRLEAEMKAQYPKITYELRPDASVAPKGRVIQNDDAAQLLCAVYAQAPWDAVRRLLLFEGDAYTSIFRLDTTASQIVFVDLIAQRVQAQKSRFPAEYLRSWRLTKLVAVYLVGQILRTTPENLELLNNPDAALTRKKINAELDRLVRFAAAALKIRQDDLKSAGQVDNFKVDFKREDALRALASTARKAYVTVVTVEN